MQIQTVRLIIEPFTVQLIDAALEKDYRKMLSLGYKTTSEWPEDDLIDALPIFRNLLIGNGVNGFNSWLIIDKELRVIVGSAGFIGNPDPLGNVEIGFGIIPSKRKMGYCYESVTALISWAGDNASVKCITAHCAESNVDSKSVIKKLGFKETEITNGLIRWEYHVNCKSHG